MADNDIINFYKKAPSDSELQKPLEEQKETPEPVVSKSVIPEPQSNDPFDKFLYNLAEKIQESKPVSNAIAQEYKEEPVSKDEPFNKFLLELAEKLQNEKVITRQQQETLAEQVKQPISTDPDEDDPFKKFIGSFANILKQDELVNREENIKEATIDFINKLKEQPDKPFIIEDDIEVKNTKQQVPLIEEDPVVEEQTDVVTNEQPENDNNYVKELKQADKNNKRTIKKDRKVQDIKSVVEKQVAEILSRYPNLGFTGGGGGTNAVQFAEGGIMRGTLNVTGHYLSGGVDLVDIFSGSGPAPSPTENYKVLSASEFNLDASQYKIFFKAVSAENYFTFSNLTSGKNVVLYLSATHNDWVRHYLPVNTYLQSAGSGNTVFTFENNVTKIDIRNINESYIGTANTVPTDTVQVSGQSFIVLDGIFGFLLQEDGGSLLYDFT